MTTRQYSDHMDCELKELSEKLDFAMAALAVYANEKHWREVNATYKELPFLTILDPDIFGDTASNEPWMVALAALKGINHTPNLRPDEYDPMRPFMFPAQIKPKQTHGTGVS